MNSFLVLIAVSLVAGLAQGTADYGAKSGHAGGCPYSGHGSSGIVLTSTDIALIRESWAYAKDIPAIQTETLLEHFRIQPRTQALFPKFADVPLNKLPSNDAFIKQARSCVSFGLNFIVANLDNPSLLKDMLGRVDTYGKWYVDFMTKERQMQTTVEIFINVLSKEMGNRLSSAAKAAWTRAMTLVFVEMMSGKVIEVSGESAITDADISRIRKSYPAIAASSTIPPKVFLKHFEIHPSLQSLFPKFADVPVSQLMSNTEFLTQAHTCLKGLFFIVENIDNDELLTRALTRMTRATYFASYMDPIHQLDETTRLFLEVASEEVQMSDKTKAAWKKALDHVMGIMAANAPFANDVARLDNSVLTVKQKALIRDSWYLARRNADIAPKVFIRHFELHPETQAMFPRFACVAKNELMNNKFFLQAAYNCFFGLTFFVKNIDDMPLVDSLLKKFASASFYVQNPSAKQQLDETTRITMEIMKEELGTEVWTAEVADAWITLLNHVHEVLADRNELKSLSADDLNVIRDDWLIVKKNKLFGANAIIKMFKAFPSTRDLFPKFANTPTSQLTYDPEFLAYGNILMAGLDFMVDNIDNTRVISQALHGKNWRKWFSPNVSITQQLEETARVFLEAMDEELGSQGIPFAKRSRETWTRAWAHMNAAQAFAFV